MNFSEKLITETVNGEVYQYYPVGEYIVRAPGVCGGRPTFKYTRIEIAGTLERLASGEDIDTIVSGYRSRVPKAAVIEAAELAASCSAERLPELEAA
jgi:uncharacterized protein (DUF433 family)